MTEIREKTGYRKSRLLKFIMSFDPGRGQAKAESRTVERG